MYLKRIGSTYYFYSRVPRDIIPLLGMTEIKKSLKTSDLKTAKAAAKVYSLDLEKLGMLTRVGIMNNQQLQKLLDRYKDGYLLPVNDARDYGSSLEDVAEHQAFSQNPIAHLNINNSFQLANRLFGEDADPEQAMQEYSRRINAVREQLKTNRFGDTIREEARAFVKRNSLDVELPPDAWFDPNDDAWHDPIKGEFLMVVRRILTTQLDIYCTEIERLRGNYQNAYDSVARNKRPPFLLTQAIDAYCAARQNDTPANEETQKRYRQYLDVMREMMGDKDVTEYTRQDLLDLKNGLHNRTANMTKNPKVKRTLDKRTVNTNYMGKMCTLFQWLYTNNYVDRDISSKLVKSLTAKEKRERKRKAYDHDDLHRIFDLLPFDSQQPHLAWVPLIAAYSGARQGEICQLLVSDIKEAHGIHYMHVTEEDDDGNIVKHLKNENSRRLVPLHPVVLEMGFLEFVQKRREQKKVVLFENRTRDRNSLKPLTGQYYSKLFQAFNRQKITKDPKKVFHSFRHLVHNDLKQAKVPPDIYHSITGHLPQHEMDQTYTEDHILKNKMEALVCLEYPLDLGTLKEKFRRLLEGM